jgi:hypothetical protein
MDGIIAFCGLNCADCPTFKATQSDDDEERKRVAEMWSKEYGAAIKPEDINCNGCISQDGRHIDYWNTCEIRKCGQQKAVENCAYCDEFACEKLEKFFGMVPQARKTLETIRQNL